jgi:hypothetical protein
MKNYLFAFILLGLVFQSKAFNVTFRLDMTLQSGFTTPEVNGTFNTWCGSCFAMTDANSDGIWEATTDLAAGTYEYKFSADSWTTQENLLAGSSCTVTNSGFTNRTLVVSADVVLPVVCWGSCVSCDDTPNFYDITFRVDMNGQSGFTTPEVNGTFNGWCGSCNPMSDVNSDGIWEATITLPEAIYEYKFSYDNWAGQETLAAGSSCTVTVGEFTNRTINLTSDVVMDAVCFGSCAACGQETGPFNITFQLDMGDVTFPFTTPEINGTFNNWCGNCAPLTDTDGDGIWTTTLSLNVGTYDYKFSYDSWTGQEELPVGGTCVFTLDGFTNRQIQVTSTTNPGVVCWQSCEACIPDNISGVGILPEIVFFPNPVKEQVTLSGLNGGDYKISIADLTGRQVLFSQIKNQSQSTLDLSQLPDAFYVLNLTGDGFVITQRIQKMGGN